MVELKLRKIDHASTDMGSANIVEIAEISSLAQWARADRGMCLIIEVTKGSSSVAERMLLTGCDELMIGEGLAAF